MTIVDYCFAGAFGLVLISMIPWGNLLSYFKREKEQSEAEKALQKREEALPHLYELERYVEYTCCPKQKEGLEMFADNFLNVVR